MYLGIINMSKSTNVLLFVAMVTAPSSSEVLQKFYERVETCVDRTTSYIQTEAATRGGCAVGCANDAQCVSLSSESLTFTKTCYRYDHALLEDGCQDGVAHYTRALTQTPVPPTCENGGVYEMENGACSCDNSYTGDRCQRLLEDCTDGVESVHYPFMNGVYTVQPSLATQPFQVHCYTNELRVLDKMKTQMMTNFTRGWVDYRNGFGNISTTNFWLGLEKLYLITNSRPGGFDLVVRAIFNDDPPTEESATYHGFKVSQESEGYSFSLEGQDPENTLSDCLGPLEGLPFTTMDVDNDLSVGNCAETYQSGWWFADCSDCNPTGVPQPTSDLLAMPNPNYLKWQTNGGYALYRLQMFLVSIE